MHVSEYIDALPEDRKNGFLKLRQTILENLPEGFEECINYSMLGYVVPHTLYPKGYHCDTSLPLPFMNLANQKNFIAFYHMGIYADETVKNTFVAAYEQQFKRKLDMGKSCMRFKKEEHIPYDLIGKLVQQISVNEWIERYEKNLQR